MMKDLPERLGSQLQFLIEIDRVKHIFRKTMLLNKSRFENDAEHGWHLALMAMVLSEYSNEPLDVSKVIKMVLIHDIVEIDAGDAIVYNTELRALAQEKEARAAERIFGLLPEDQRRVFMDLWQEFEARISPEARFAAAIDRFEPILQNKLTDYETWKTHNISYTQLQDKNRHIQEGSRAIWEIVQEIIEEARASGEIRE